jgi:hypothetical protein
MEAVLDRLHTEKLTSPGCPLAVSISIPDHEIYIGLGSFDSFVMVGAEPYDDWYVALGDEKANGDSKMFYGSGQDSYWAPKNLIPVAVAREAVRYYVEHHQRIPTLRWQH